ncbi:hypothetical protein [Actibacterium sp. D379-3]
MLGIFADVFRRATFTEPPKDMPRNREYWENQKRDKELMNNLFYQRGGRW